MFAAIQDAVFFQKDDFKWGSDVSTILPEKTVSHREDGLNLTLSNLQ